MATFNATLLVGGNPVVLRHTLAAPTGLSAVADTGPVVDLTWTDNSGGRATAFSVERSADAGESWSVVAFVAASPHEDATVSEGTSYLYRVTATAGAVTSPPSATDSAGIPGPPPPAAPVFGATLADLGMNTSLVEWSDAIPTGFWMWQLRPVDFPGSGYPHLLVGQHDVAYGARIYRNRFPVDATYACDDATTSVYGVDSADLGSAGTFFTWDFNGDGYPDLLSIHHYSHQNSFAYNSATGELDLAVGVNISRSTDLNHLYEIGDHDGDGDVDAKSLIGKSAATLASLDEIKLHRKTWDGTAFTYSVEDYTWPAGVPSAVLDDVLARLQSAPFETGLPYRQWMDVDGDGEDELIIMGYFSYNSNLNFIYILKDVGGGTFEDRTETWGIPRLGSWLPLMDYHWAHKFRIFPPNRHLHTSIDGAGTFCAFVAGSSANGGFYKWTGSGFTRQSGTLTDVLKLTATPDQYVPQIFAVDLTNSGHLDLVYRRPRLSYSYVFLNDAGGTGAFALHSGQRPGGAWWSWDPYGFAFLDFNDNGLLDMALGGTSTTAAQSARQARYVSLLRNETTDPGNYLKVRIRRSSGSNRFGIGGTVAVYGAGQSFADAALLRRWAVDPDGMPHHFGLGSAATVDVRFAPPVGGAVDQTAVAANQTITITG